MCANMPAERASRPRFGARWNLMAGKSVGMGGQKCAGPRTAAVAGPINGRADVQGHAFEWWRATHTTLYSCSPP